MTGDLRPVVSVVIPVFDRPDHIVEAVESVLTQDDVDVEVIVVDDGSGPETADAVDRLAAMHPNVTVFHQPNGGPSAARNRGVAAATGAWLTFLDSDDLMTPGRLREQVEILTPFTAPTLVLGEERIEVAPGVEPPITLTAHLTLPRPHWYGMSLMMRREVFDLVGRFDESMRHGEDTEFLVRSKIRNVRHERRERIWTVRRIFGDNLIADLDGSHHGLLQAFRKNLGPRL